MDWIVHIGYQKTGSKALQRFLSEEPQQRPATLRELERLAALDEPPAIVQRAHEATGSRFIDIYREQGIQLIDASTRAAINDRCRESNEWARKL